MQGKLIAVVYTLRIHIETSSLWAEFVNKNRCISVHLVSEEVKSIKFDNFDNSHSFLWPEYFIDFFMWKMDPMSSCNIRLVFTLPPRDSTCCSTKDAYTSEITFLALHPWIHVFSFCSFLNPKHDSISGDGALKVTVYVISSDLPFKEEHPRFTTIPFKPLTDHRGQRSQCIYLLNTVQKDVKLECALAYCVNSTRMTSH